MNVEFVERKKGLKVLDSKSAILKSWRIGFNFMGPALVEPSWANALHGGESDEIHGVAIKLSAEDKISLDSQEGAGPGQTAYTQIPVQVTTYDGETLDTYIYSKLIAPGPGGEIVERACSIRYRNILVSGATAAGLDPVYIEKLSAMPTYSPTPETLALREALPAPESLPAITVVELAASKETPTPCGFSLFFTVFHHFATFSITFFIILSMFPSFPLRREPSDLWRTSVLGYVFELPRSAVHMNSHRARDITARMSRQWRGLSLDTDDDFGRPPYVFDAVCFIYMPAIDRPLSDCRYRLPSHMETPEEVEHVER